MVLLGLWTQATLAEDSLEESTQRYSISSLDSVEWSSSNSKACLSRASSTKVYRYPDDGTAVLDTLDLGDILPTRAFNTTWVQVDIGDGLGFLKRDETVISRYINGMYTNKYEIWYELSRRLEPYRELLEAAPDTASVKMEREVEGQSIVRIPVSLRLGMDKANQLRGLKDWEGYIRAWQDLSIKYPNEFLNFYEPPAPIPLCSLFYQASAYRQWEKNEKAYDIYLEIIEKYPDFEMGNYESSYQADLRAFNYLHDLFFEDEKQSRKSFRYFQLIFETSQSFRIKSAAGAEVVHSLIKEKQIDKAEAVINEIASYPSRKRSKFKRGADMRLDSICILAIEGPSYIDPERIVEILEDLREIDSYQWLVNFLLVDLYYIEKNSDSMYDSILYCLKNKGGHTSRHFRKDINFTNELKVKEKIKENRRYEIELKEEYVMVRDELGFKRMNYWSMFSKGRIEGSKFIDEKLQEWKILPQPVIYFWPIEQFDGKDLHNTSTGSIPVYLEGNSRRDGFVFWTPKDSVAAGPEAMLNGGWIKE